MDSLMFPFVIKFALSLEFSKDTQIVFRFIHFCLPFSACLSLSLSLRLSLCLLSLLFSLYLTHLADAHLLNLCAWSVGQFVSPTSPKIAKFRSDVQT